MRDEKWKVFLKDSAVEIDKHLEKIFATWITEVEQISPRLLPLVRELREASKGGKRIRGALVLLGYSIYSSSDPALPEESRSPGSRQARTIQSQKLLQIAAAYEIFQTAILVHDDVIDKSPLRRGKPSVHEQLGGGHYGISQSISLGDAGFFLAFRILSQSTFPESEKNKALAFFSQTLLDTTIGQMLDVDVALKKGEVSEQDVLEIARYKTAKYTFTGPLALGAVLGGASDEALEAIKMFGEQVGIAFQLQDDYKDIFGTEEYLKKEIGGDIKEGKQTMLYLYAASKADATQRKLLETYYGNPHIDKEGIEAIRQVFRETNALDRTQSNITELIKKAKSVIHEITDDEEKREILEGIVAFVAHYEK